MLRLKLKLLHPEVEGQEPSSEKAVPSHGVTGLPGSPKHNAFKAAV